MFFWKKNKNFTPGDFSIVIKISGKQFKIEIGNLDKYNQIVEAANLITEAQVKLNTTELHYAELKDLHKQIVKSIDLILGHPGAAEMCLGSKIDNLYNCYQLMIIITGKITSARVDLIKNKVAHYASK